ncbi:MAG: hypothetical protein GC168_15230 [Candidatus Hydrogenedens sp.]|nr:hypothetical protein [Candidatus Hydrogenedens sp.]
MGTEWMHTLDIDGRTPLDRAYASGHPVMADLMLRQEKEDQNLALSGASALHRAAYLGLSGAVKSLLTYGAAEEQRDEQGETPLHKAARRGHADTVEILVRISDVNAISNDGLTPLHWAAISGRADVARLLVQHGADQHLRNESMDGLSPLDIARAMGFAECEEVLESSRIYA